MAGETPSFTVIVCNHNDSAYLADAVARIFGQTRPPDQVVVVDDGSDDGSREILRDLAERHDALEAIFLESNRGVVAAGLAGLRAARGDFLSWWSVDDRISPDLIADVERAAAACPGTGVIVPEADVVEETGTRLAPLYGYRYGIADGFRYLAPDEIERVHRHRYLWLASSGAFLRRDALLDIGGWDPELDWFADWFALYALAFRHGAVLVARPLSKVVRRPASYGERRRRDRAAARAVVTRFFDLLRIDEFAGMRRALRAGPLCLAYALGRRMIPAVVRRPGEWRFGLATAVAWWRHRIARRLRRAEPDIDTLLDRDKAPPGPEAGCGRIGDRA